MDFWFGGSEFGEDAAEAERVFAEGGAHEVVAGGGGVALVEDEVDDLEDGGEAGGELEAAGDLEGDVFVGEGAFGADDALCDGGFGGQESAGDLVGGEAAEQTEGEGCAGLGGEDGVTGDEDQAEEVVSGGGGVALVEDEVDDFEDGGEARGELGAVRDFEGDVFFGEGAFGAEDALSDVGSGVRKARAISAVVSPPRDSVERMA